ncbi:MAG: ribonuclease D, partial [Geminicoccaceae bacterium]
MIRHACADGQRSYARARMASIGCRIAVDVAFNDCLTLMTLLTTTAEVESLCRELAEEDFVTIDTEFMRDRTYWPKLCLVQLAGKERFAAIDPLAPGIDLQPLFDLVVDAPPVKVFHACRQDVEIFYHLTGKTPAPVFDTQLAAMVLGYGDEVGYDALVTKIAKARIDKSSRFTDWSHRPLSEQQLSYALADVTHLRVIYERLKAELEEAGRTDWAAEELHDLTSPDTYEQPPELAWKRLKIRSKDPRFIAIAQALG